MRGITFDYGEAVVSCQLSVVSYGMREGAPVCRRSRFPRYEDEGAKGNVAGALFHQV